MLLAFPWATSEALALAPGDLIIVCNRKVPESQAVAAYYAEKRRVPPANIVAVEVTTSEHMSRKEFDNSLLPPVRQAAERLKSQGATPAVLLVYGIPLMVTSPGESDADKALRELAAARAGEYRGLVQQMVGELDRLMETSDAGGKPPRRLTYPPRPMLEMAERSLNQAVQYLGKEASRAGEEPARVKVLSLLIRLVGTSPEAAAKAAKMSKESTSTRERELIQGQELLGWNAIMRRELEEGMFSGVLPETALKTAAAVRFANGIIGEWQFWENLHTMLEKREKGAGVDSELTLALRDGYQLSGWLPNPFQARYDRLPCITEVREKTLMVGRLDGPTPEIAKRLVDDALATEEAGLQGNFYIDARGLTGEAKYGNYVWYDEHLAALYELVKEYSIMKVVIDRNPELFPPGSCPDAALYVGWYSLGNYVASCKWNRGAVAFHVASAEATTLKGLRNVWCKRLLEEGVAATLGPVAEPYLGSFPSARRVFPPAHGRGTAAAGSLLPHRALRLLDANPHRRSPVHPLQEQPGNGPARARER